MRPCGHPKINNIWVDEIENGCTLHTQLFLKQSWEQKEDPSTMSCLTQVGHRKWAGRSQLTAEQVGSVVSTIVKEAAPPEKNPPSNLCGDIDAACHVRQSKEKNESHNVSLFNKLNFFICEWLIRTKNWEWQRTVTQPRDLLWCEQYLRWRWSWKHAIQSQCLKTTNHH